MWILPACKPGSVECYHSDGHSSRRTVTRPLEQPTRSVLIGVGHPSLPIWPCSRWGLPSHSCYQLCGELLPRRFTLACVPGTGTIGGLLSVALSVNAQTTALPRRYLAARPLEPGLSSNTRVLATIRPTVSTTKGNAGRPDDVCVTSLSRLIPPPAS